jgi:hypothetical protein
MGQQTSYKHHQNNLSGMNCNLLGSNLKVRFLLKRVRVSRGLARDITRNRRKLDFFAIWSVA